MTRTRFHVTRLVWEMVHGPLRVQEAPPVADSPNSASQIHNWCVKIVAPGSLNPLCEPLQLLQTSPQKPTMASVKIALMHRDDKFCGTALRCFREDDRKFQPLTDNCRLIDIPHTTTTNTRGETSGVLTLVTMVSKTEWTTRHWQFINRAFRKDNKLQWHPVKHVLGILFTDRKGVSVIEFWDVDKQKRVTVIKSHTLSHNLHTEFIDFCWDPTGRRIIIYSDCYENGSEYLVWKVWRGGDVWVSELDERFFGNVRLAAPLCGLAGCQSWNATGTYILIKQDTTLDVYNVETKKVHTSLSWTGHPLMVCAWHPRDPNIIAVSSVTWIRIWHIETDEKGIADTTSSDGKSAYTHPSSLQWSYDGSYLLFTGTQTKTIALRNMSRRVVFQVWQITKSSKPKRVTELNTPFSIYTETPLWTPTWHPHDNLFSIVGDTSERVTILRPNGPKLPWKLNGVKAMNRKCPAFFDPERCWFQDIHPDGSLVVVMHILSTVLHVYRNF